MIQNENHSEGFDHRRHRDPAAVGAGPAGLHRVSGAADPTLVWLFKAEFCVILH